MLGKPRILSLFPNLFNKSIKHENSFKILYIKCTCMKIILIIKFGPFTFNSLHSGYFFMLSLSSADFLKKIFQEHYQSVKRFGTRSVGLDLGPHCLTNKQCCH